MSNKYKNTLLTNSLEYPKFCSNKNIIYAKIKNQVQKSASCQKDYEKYFQTICHDYKHFEFIISFLITEVYLFSAQSPIQPLVNSLVQSGFNQFQTTYFILN